MRYLRTIAAIKDYITKTPDRSIANLLASHLEYVAGDEGEPLTVIVIEPGDSLVTLDAHFDGGLLINHYSGRRFGEVDFVPPFETAEEQDSFYEMFFISGDEGTSVIVPRGDDINQDLLALCAAFATPYQESS
jgi:hypothetical protein